jgi:Holliday junction resolvase
MTTSRSKINSKQKGARFERLLASRFREYGFDARRTAQYCGNTGDAADVTGLPGVHVEAKHAEQMRLYEWIAQAKRDAEAGGKGNLPAVFHKKNHAEILVTVEFDTFMQLYKEWWENNGAEDG